MSGDTVPGIPLVGNPDDRRSSLVDLTAEGRGALERGAAVVEDGLSEHLGDDIDVMTVT